MDQKQLLIAAAVVLTIAIIAYLGYKYWKKHYDCEGSQVCTAESRCARCTSAAAAKGSTAGAS